MMGARSTADRLDSSTDDIRLISAVEMRLVNGATAIIAMPLKIICKPGTHPWTRGQSKRNRWRTYRISMDSISPTFYNVFSKSSLSPASSRDTYLDCTSCLITLRGRPPIRGE